MHNIRNVSYKYTLFLLLLLLGCSSEKDTFIARNYHTFVSYFNGFYNANRLFKEGVKKMEATSTPVNDENWTPVYIPKGSDKSAFQNFNKAIKKCDVIIYRHKNGKFIDDCRFLNGKCWYYKQNFPLAKQHFEYILIAFPETPLKDEVIYWLARTQYAEGSIYSAQQTLEKLLPFSKIKKRKLRKDVKILYAMLLVKQDEIPAAITFLEKTLADIKKKKEKAEIYFLLAQLYQKINDYKKAREYYQKVAKLNTSDDLAFAATMKEIQMITRNPNASQQDLKKAYSKLKAMKDDKRYDKYKYQIYYEIAYIAQRANKPDKAIPYLKKSLATNTDDEQLRLKAYWELGEIYFKNNDFNNAQAYYDSAASIVKIENENYSQIKGKAEKLKDFVFHKNRIHLNDSLLTLSAMPKDKLKKYVENLIREEEDRERMKKLQEQQNNNFYDPSLQNINNSSGKFYFDDPTQVQAGKMKFKQIWGNRPNEDHWRRSNKQKIFAQNPEDINNKQKQKDNSREEKIKKYLAKVPKNEEDKQKLLKEIEESYIKVAWIFLEDFKMKEEALNTLIKFYKRFPNSKYSPKVLYTIYTIAKDLNKTAMAEKYKQELLNKYPDSKYAKMILQPDKVVSNEAEQDFETAYEGLLKLYDNKEYNSVISFSDFMIKKFAEHPEIDKVYFLRGAAFSKIGKKDSLIKVYTTLIQKFPNTETAKIARKILENTEGEKPVSEATRKNANYVKRKEKLRDNDPAFRGFSVEKKPNEKVLVVILIDKNAIKVHDLKAMITDFNRRFFENERLSMNVFFYKDKHLVYIAQFPDYKTADAYLRTLEEAPQISSLIKDISRDAVFISPTNFRVAYSQKRFEDYGKFFSYYREKWLEE